MNRRQIQPGPLRTAGFTLVEVMLTTVLAAVLLLALWSLLSMYSKTFEGGHARTEQSQLARVLLEQMSTDFQNVLVAPTVDMPAAAAFGESPLSSVPSASDRATVRPTVVASASVPVVAGSPSTSATANVSGDAFLPGGSEVATSSHRPAGLFGTATFLQIDVVQPAILVPQHPSEAQVVDPESPSGADELKTIIYVFEEYRNPANSSADSATRLVRRELSWAEAHPARGLGRGDNTSSTWSSNPSDLLETQAAPTAEPLGDHNSFLSPSDFTIPEVLEFSLRYFDGALWSEEWDSVSRRSLPAAIEVSLRLRSFEEVARPTTDELASKGNVDLAKLEQWKHPVERMLIPLPLAQKPSGMRSSVPGAAAEEGGERFLGAETHARLNQQ